MEEEMQSVISNCERIVEISDSNSRTQTFPASKRPRNGSILCPSKFKGVVRQQNGNWGAQIYVSRQRIWLGTFKSEGEAAMAYDSAAIKLHSGDSHRNFEWTSITHRELNFQSPYSTEAVLNMIRDGTYQSKFAHFLRICSQNAETEIGVSLASLHASGGLMWKLLFQKELTTSDVGKLNRVVIPKKYAMKYFPAISGPAEENAERECVGKQNDVQLVLYDRSMRPWSFRYCYWRSSQSFVFTRGWNRFVKEKQLKVNDVISFYVRECREQVNEGGRFFIIDINKGERNRALVGVANQCVDRRVDLQLRLGCNVVRNEDDEKVEEKVLTGEKPTDDCNRKSFRLFGLEII